MQSILPVAAALIAGLIAVALTPMSIWLARALGLMDTPDARKVHTTPTPRIGGIAIFAGTLLSAGGAALYLRAQGAIMPPGLGLQLLAIGFAGIFVFTVGLVDDLQGVSSRSKLFTLVAASLVICGSGASFGQLLWDGEALLEFRWLTWLATMVWIIGIAVAVNFIDGLDGLAGGVTLLSALVLTYFLLAGGQLAAAIIPLALAGALSGFLIFNWHPARTFMGDSGSMTIGFLMGACMVMANPLVGSMRGLVLPALALSVPIVDAVLTFFRRHYQQRRSIFSAEQGHIHHGLLEQGLTHRQAVLAIYGVSVAAVAIGFLALSFNGVGTLGGLSLLVPLLWGAFRVAGSLKTGEMLTALRRKREIDKRSRHFRDSFETLQLEFNRVYDFAGWWQGICRSADRLEFLSVTLPVTNRDGSVRRLEWRTTDDRFEECARITADVPIADRRSGEPPLQATVRIPAATSLESAGERLALFSRLMHDHSLVFLEQRARQNTSKAKKLNARLKRSGPGVASPSAPCLPMEKRGPFGHLRVAIVHDFYYTYAGAERVVEQLIDVFPHCDLFALFDFLPDDQRQFLRGKPVQTSFLQRMPFARKRHRAYLPLIPLAIEQLDVTNYDLVVSSSYLAAKGVITGPDQLHVSYCHSPARYAWDLHHRYLDEAGLGFGPKGMFARAVLHYIRQWDVRTSLGVDHFIANSRFVARRINKLYRREATVVHAPVNTEFYVPSAEPREDYYLAVSRMVAYKQTDLMVAAFSKLPHLKLKVIGDGPDFEKVRRIAGPNVELLGRQDDASVRRHLQRAKALIFAAEEDFGIVPVEAMACGTPVIAYGKGGVTESVTPRRHGVFFLEQTEEALTDAIQQFESGEFSDELVQSEIRRHAERFSNERFTSRVKELVGQWVVQKWPELVEKRAATPPRNEPSMAVPPPHLDLQPAQEALEQSPVP